MTVLVVAWVVGAVLYGLFWWKVLHPMFKRLERWRARVLEEARQ